MLTVNTSVAFKPNSRVGKLSLNKSGNLRLSLRLRREILNSGREMLNAWYEILNRGFLKLADYLKTGNPRTRMNGTC